MTHSTEKESRADRQTIFGTFWAEPVHFLSLAQWHICTFTGLGKLTALLSHCRVERKQWTTKEKKMRTERKTGKN